MGVFPYNENPSSVFHINSSALKKKGLWPKQPTPTSSTSASRLLLHGLHQLADGGPRLRAGLQHRRHQGPQLRLRTVGQRLVRAGRNVLAQDVQALVLL